MGTLKLQQVSPVTVSGTTSTLANNTRVKVGTLDNSSTGSLCPNFDLRLTTGFSTAPTPGNGIVIHCYLVPYVDGVNPGTVDSSTPYFPPSSFVGDFVVMLSQTSAQYLDVQGVTLNALKYDVWLDNQSGETMAANWVFTAAPTDQQY